MNRYEDNNSSTTLLFFVVGSVLTVLSVGGLVFIKWNDVIEFGIPVETMPIAEWTQEGCLIVGSLCLIFLWLLYDRPRLIAEPSGNVWVRNGGCGEARFRWSEVVGWRVDVTPICMDEGVDVARTIVVELASKRLLRIHDDQQSFVRAFREYVPDREIAEQFDEPRRVTMSAADG